MAVDIEAEIPVLYDQTLYGKKASFPIFCGQSANLVSALMDSEGNLLEIPDGAELVVSYKEAFDMSWRSGGNASLISASEARFRWAMPKISAPGIYDMAVTVKQPETDELLQMVNFYIYAQPSPWVNRRFAGQGVPHLDVIRLRLRDSVLQENELWQHRQNQLTEICEAIVRTVDSWNTSPPISPTLSVTTSSFPCTELLLTGTTLHLAMMLLEHYRKNSLQYQAAGMAVNDSKLQEYTMLYDEMRQRFDTQVMQLKSQWNLRRLFAII